MSASIEIHEIRLTDRIAADGGQDWPLTVILPDGRQLVIWPSGGFTVKLPSYYEEDGTPSAKYFTEVNIELPKDEDLGTQCTGEDEQGNFTVIATHRH